MNDLPEGWREIPLGKFADIKGGSQPPKKEFLYSPKDGYVRLLQIRDFGIKPVPTYVPLNRVSKFCSKEDILIARYGASLGRIVTGMEGAYNVALAKICLKSEDIEKRYLFYLFQTPIFQTPIHMISRSAQNGFNTTEIYPIKFPIAPLPEQRRIVAKIEELFSKLDAGVDALKKAKAQLKRYRQSVLAAAVTGELTKEWREANPNTEPASELLKRILKQRSEQWNGNEKYKEPKEPKSMLVDGVPLNWSYGTIDQIGDVNLGKMLDKKKHTQGQRLPYLRNINIRWGRIDVSDLSKMHFKDSELERYGLRKDDLLVCEGGEPGRAAVWDGRLTKLKYQKALHRVRLRDGVDPKFAILCLERDSKSGQLERRFTGSTIKHFTRQAFIEYEIPIPPIAEQRKIVAEVEARKTAIDRIESELEQQFVRASRFRQSALAAAFTGNL